MKLHQKLGLSTLVSLLGLASSAAWGAVTFSGLDEELEGNARALMTLAAAPCDAPVWRVERLFRDADKQLQNALEALGYYRFEVEKHLSFENADCWSANFDLIPGEPVRIRDVLQYP